MKKKKHGTYELLSTASDDGICIVRWVDNSVVTITSTCNEVQPLSNVSQYSATDKEKIYVSRPSVFGAYNSAMGGTDRMDQNVGYYRIGVCGKNDGGHFSYRRLMQL